MQFSSEEVELLLQIARDGASGSSFLERIDAIADALAALVPFSTVSAFVLHPEAGEGPAQGHLLFRDRSPGALAEYAQHYLAIDPMAVTFPEGKGVPYLLSDFARGRTFGKDAFTSDFMPGLGIRHILALGHRMPGGEMLSFAIHRAKGLRDFTNHERELMRLASPDIKRAIHAVLVSEQVEQLKQQSAAEARSGALVFDGQGDLLHADPGAVKLAERLRDRRGLPCDLFVGEVRRLLKAGGRAPLAVERTYQLLGGRWIRARYSLAVKVRARCVVVLLEELTPGTQDQFEALVRRARLTRRERDVAELVVQGLGNRQIGLKLGMSSVTVGVHLTQIYKKTGAAGRNELTTLFLGGQPPTGAVS